ncbi:MAG: helix-turn-helix domain-containing protein, partial [Candidatus Hydrogenedentes bacterium]|nr:helix-turn-helix domain-containing protein [Candidatus Hydrogenedentota bacterium]
MRRDAVITIIRVRRRRRFVILDQQAVDDERLSWAARGLLHYLLARPDDWKVLVKDLQRRGDLKRDGIYKLLKELRKIGYARLVWIRDEQGRVCGAIYYIYEQP